MWDTSEALEPLRVPKVCVDGLRGGRAGDGSAEFVFVRPGRGGGARRPGTASGASRTGPAVVVRRGKAGMVSFFCGRAGIVGLLSTAIPFPFNSNLGRFGGGGGRFRGPSPLLLKFFCWLRAAIRWANELNCGSSISAILDRSKGFSAVLDGINGTIRFVDGIGGGRGGN
jgi:hypothetical protein